MGGLCQAAKLLDYLGRYLKRVAISNDRILKNENGQVQFSYRDYADNSKRKVMMLSGVEFCVASYNTFYLRVIARCVCYHWLVHV